MLPMAARAGAELAYRQAGAGPLIVLVHAGFVDSRACAGMLAILQSDHTVVAPDRRGHGQSAPYGGGHWFDDAVDDLTDLVLRIAEPAAPVVIVAHSGGCHVALVAALRLPQIRQLFLYEAPIFGAPPI